MSCFDATDITGYHRLAYCCTSDIHLWVLNPYEICTFSDLCPYCSMFIKHLEVTVLLVESWFHEHFSWIIYSSCKRTTKTVYHMGNNVMYGFFVICTQSWNITMNGKSFVFKMTAPDLNKVVCQIFYNELFLRKTVQFNFS